MSKRGTNPNTRAAVNASNMRRKIDRLHRELGEISKSESDRLLAQSPVALQLCLYLQEQEGDRAAKLLHQLSELLVQQAYEEAIVDGAIELPGGAWVV